MAINWESHLEFDEELLQLSNEGLIQREIAERMTIKFNIPFTRNSIKGRLEYINSPGYKYKKSELQQRDTQENKMLSKKDIENRAIGLNSYLKEELSKATSYHTLKTIHSSKGDTLVIHLTDWHVGKEIKNELNEIIYNEAIFKFRIDILLQEILRLLDNHIKGGTPIKDAVIISTGDLVDGSGIFATQQFQSELSPPFQVMTVVNTLQSFILSLLERKLNVYLKCVKGNHGEVREGGKNIDPLANWDLMVYLILEYWIRNLKNKHLSIVYSELDYLNFKIQDWNYHIRHIAPVQPETAAGKAKFLGWKDTHHFDALVFGHFHHWAIFEKSGVPIFRGGSLTGADE